ncbi:MAG: AI-2E family transporter [Armatimonadetes bacterium]|nr:AI-2E family transporter [Armatimonadota bacterium]
MHREPFDKSYRHLVFWAITVIVFVTLARMLEPFSDAILWAIVLSILMWPIQMRFRKRFSENISSLFTVFSTILIVIIPIGLAALMVASQIKGMQEVIDSSGQPHQKWTIEQTIADIDKAVHPTLEKLGSDVTLTESWALHKDEWKAKLGTAAPKVLTALATSILTVIFALLTMFFMIRDADKLREPILELIPLQHDQTSAILQRLYQTVRGVFVGVVMVSLVQGALATTFYAIAGVPSPLVFGLVTTIFCVIPMLGAPVIYAPLGAMLLVQGNVPAALWVLIGGFGVVSQIDNFLRPFLIGAKVNMHPMGVFFSILGGILVFGPVGLMIGPVILAIGIALVEIIRERRRDDIQMIEG